MTNNIVKIYQETDLEARLESNLTTTGLTFYATFYDSKTQALRTPRSTTNILTINKGNSRSEIVRVASFGSPDSNGKILVTLESNGRALNKYGLASGGATGNRHLIGDLVGCVTNHLGVEELNAFVNGTTSSGGANLRVGAGTNVDIKLVVENGDTNPPFLMYDASENAWVYSNNGVDTVAIGGGASTYTGGDGITITAGDIDIDLTDSNVFGETGNSKALKTKSDGKINSSVIELDSESLELSSNEVQVKLKTGGGITKGADGLLTDPASVLSGTETLYALEALTAGQIAVNALLSWEGDDIVATTTSLTFFTRRNLADSNANARLAVRIPVTEATTLTNRSIVIDQIGSGAGTVTLSVYSDNAGTIGTLLGSGTVSGVSTTEDWRTATFSPSISLSAGSYYWLVVSTSSIGDGSNYYTVKCINTSYSSLFLPTTSKLYDAFSGTWGADSQNYMMFHKGTQTNFGRALIKAQASEVSGATILNRQIGKRYIAGASISAMAQGVCYGRYYPISANVGTTYYIGGTDGTLSTSSLITDGYLSLKVGTVEKLADGNTYLKIETPEAVRLLLETITIEYIYPNYKGAIADRDGGGSPGTIITASAGTNIITMSSGTATPTEIIIQN